MFIQYAINAIDTNHKNITKSDSFLWFDKLNAMTDLIRGAEAKLSHRQQIK